MINFDYQPATHPPQKTYSIIHLALYPNRKQQVFQHRNKNYILYFWISTKSLDSTKIYLPYLNCKSQYTTIQEDCSEMLSIKSSTEVAINFLLNIKILDPQKLKPFLEKN